MAEAEPRLLALLFRVHELYRAAFAEDSRGRQLVASFGLTDLGLVERFQIGYAAGTLKAVLPHDAAVRRDLRTLGLWQGPGYGREALAGKVVVPLTDSHGRIVELVGLPGPKVAGLVRGCVFNWPTLKSHGEVFKLSDLVESLKRIQAGSENVIAVVDPPTEETQRVLTEFGPRILNEPESPAAARPQGVTELEDGFGFEVGKRRYLVQGLSKDSPRKLRAVVRAVPPQGSTRLHVDVIDLYSARDRVNYAREAAMLFHENVGLVEEDLARLLELAEPRASHGREPAPVIGDADRREALECLHDPDVLDRVLSGFEALGLVGERENKLAGYLVAVSRKMPDPLSLLILSRSAAGKSALAEAVASLVPPEDIVRITRLTSQALFYQKKAGLQHKLLVVEEESGVTEAAYPLRILQSARRLAVTTPHGSHDVEGPVAVIVTTTRPVLDDETKSRFLVVSVDESREQTKAIHQKQRERETLAEIMAVTARGRIASLHWNVQRLLRPLVVVNPFAPTLSFPSDRLSTRREQPKFLALIRAVTFLRQYRREVKREGGIEFVEVAKDDLDVAESLSKSILAQGLDDLSPPARRLLSEVQAWGRREFTRREAREALGWAQASLRRAMTELLDHEFVGIAGVGPGRHVRYEFSEIHSDSQKSKTP